MPYFKKTKLYQLLKELGYVAPEFKSTGYRFYRGDEWLIGRNKFNQNVEIWHVGALKEGSNVCVRVYISEWSEEDNKYIQVESSKYLNGVLVYQTKRNTIFKLDRVEEIKLLKHHTFSILGYGGRKFYFEYSLYSDKNIALYEAKSNGNIEVVIMPLKGKFRMLGVEDNIREWLINNGLVECTSKETGEFVVNIQNVIMFQKKCIGEVV